MILSLLQRIAPWWLLGTVFLFSGCAALSPFAPEPPSERIAQLWQQHVQSVNAQTDWTLSARIAAHSEDDGWNGKLHWRQEKNTYQVSFNAPFGQGGLQLDGGPQYVEMRTSDGQTMVAEDVESLLYQHLGWRLPLHSLRYWVRGVPVPMSDKAPLLAFDEEGRLARLQQSRWQIEYLAYRQVDRLMLPRKVYLENGELSVRLVIDRWESDDGGH
ncbi:MAG: lipoprotein insertase outer membrane protein LolB [Gammaproteobacteria bacterium]|nr:lipoprotein insertase outer membrane protein LolB [Gammaproteobacteria bacterium]